MTEQEHTDEGNSRDQRWPGGVPGDGRPELSYTAMGTNRQ